MELEIREVSTKKELKRFVKFPLDLFKGNEYYVPQLNRDELETFTAGKNPAFEVCDGKLFLAYKDDKVAGRIVAILNKPENEKYKTKHLRFGWFDCINDYEVASSLFQAAEAWGKQLGMDTITGPHGFCDLDPQGMLIEGFDKLPTIASYYHFPYYKDLVEKYGFEKEIDFVEFQSTPPYEIIDFLFAGVKKEYRGKGVDTVMILEIVKSAMKLGFKHAESNQELEDNTKVQAEWKFFNPVLHKRRRIYKKKIS